MPQIRALSARIQPTDGSALTEEDASQGWELYRALSLKMTRLAGRVEELLAASLVPMRAAGPSGGE